MTSERLQLDFETRSACDLKTAGAYRYSMHPTTEVTHMGYAFDGEPVEVWMPGKTFPREVADHVRSMGNVVCHNASFERRIWNNVLRKMVKNLPEMRAEQQSCTLARALVLSYPDDLNLLCKVLGVHTEKDMEGHRLMLQNSKAISVDLNGSAVFREISQSEITRIAEYNRRDVEAQREVDKLLPELTPREREIWLLDQRINDRGVPIDVREVQCAQALAKFSQRMVDAEMRELTGGFVRKATESAKLVEWFNGRGMPTNSAREFDLSQVDTSCHPNAARIVDLRTNGAKSSVAKFGKMLGCVHDGLLRDQYAYHKTVQGRWAGRLVQLQNLKRIADGDDFGPLFNAFDAFGLDAESAYWHVHFMTGEPVLAYLSRSLRQFIKAEPGKVFFGGDFSNVEGRFNAWVAGEEWKLTAFRDYDAGIGPDLYKLGAAQLFGKSIEEITKFERQIGKVRELALGYQGAVYAFISMGPTYGLRPGDVVAAIRETTEPGIWRQFAESHNGARDKHGLNVDCWVAIKIIVRNFRMQNERIAQGWYNLQESAVAALRWPGHLVEVPDCRGVSYLYTDGTLWCKLPSKRLLAYVQASIVEQVDDSLVWTNGLVEDPATYTQADIESFIDLGLAQLVHGKPRRQVRFWHKVGKSWMPGLLYGGLQCAHVVSGSCRDFEADAMLAAEQADYPVVLHTHDDIVTKRDLGHGSIEEFAAIMGRPSKWAPGMPLAVKCWTGTRYGD